MTIYFPSKLWHIIIKYINVIEIPLVTTLDFKDIINRTLKFNWSKFAFEFIPIPSEYNFLKNAVHMVKPLDAYHGRYDKQNIFSLIWKNNIMIFTVCHIKSKKINKTYKIYFSKEVFEKTFVEI